MARNSPIPAEKEMEIYQYLDAHPNMKQIDIAKHFKVSNATVSRIKKKFSTFSKNDNIVSINRIDDLLMLLSDAIFKVRFGTMEPNQARTFGYLVNTYFKIILDRDKVSDDDRVNLKDYISSLTNEELMELAEEDSA